MDSLRLRLMTVGNGKTVLGPCHAELVCHDDRPPQGTRS